MSKRISVKLMLALTALFVCFGAIAFAGCETDARAICAKRGHVFEDYISDDNATCTADGTLTAKCNRCGEATDTVTMENSKLGHDEITYKAKAPTCTEIGWNNHTECERCGFSEDKIEYPALGHDEINHDGKLATCTEIGYDAYVTCSRCDYDTYKEIPAAGHKIETIVDEPASCTENGTAHDECSVCHVTDRPETISVLGHNYIDCFCSRCGNKEADAASLNVYNGRYGYNFLAKSAYGPEKQVLYNRIDRAVKAFHADETRSGGSDYSIATINFSNLELDYKTAVSVLKTYKDDNPLFYWLSSTATFTDNDVVLFVDPDYSDGEVRAKANKSVYSAVKSYGAS